MIPGWILDSFAALMLAVAALSACRLVAARAWSRPATDADIDAAHVLMGVAMAGMLATGLRTLPDGGWVAVFAVVTGWFGWRVAVQARGAGLGARLTSHHLPHLVHGAAMIYMFAAVSTVAVASAGASASAQASAGAGMGVGGMSGGLGSGMGVLSVPAIGLAFVLIMAGWAVWDLDRITGARQQAAMTRTLLDPRVATSGRVAVGVTMALMLVIMI